MCLTRFTFLLGVLLLIRCLQKRTKKGRTLEIDDTCHISGCETENAYHAVIQCTKAKALRDAMRKFWSLPEENIFGYTGSDWLIILLARCTSITRDKLLILMWRAWHLRNDMVHHDGNAKVMDSVIFLQNYWDCLVDDLPVATDDKGKKSVNEIMQRSGSVSPKNRSGESWTKPPEGYAKLNVDASYIEDLGTGAAGIVCRNDEGAVIFSAGLEEAEAHALLAAVDLTKQVFRGPIIIESDCSAVVTAINSSAINKSNWWAIYEDAKRAISEFRYCLVVKIGRESNRVAHELAAHSRIHGDFFLPASVPSHIIPMCEHDCNLDTPV